MPPPTDFSTFNCSLARALAIVGDGWSILIVRDATLGISRFSDFQRSLGIAKNILAERLDRLVDAGIFARSGEPRARYVLSAKGYALLPALIALAQWGDTWVSDAPPMLFTDAGGRPVDTVRLTVENGAADVVGLRVRPGPGADARTRAFLSASKRPHEG